MDLHPRGAFVPEVRRLDVLTLLSREAAEKFQYAVPAGSGVRHAGNANAFMGELRARSWTAFVLDPTELSVENLSLVGLEAGAMGSSLLLLAPPTPLAARRVAAAACLAPVQVLLSDCESTDRLLALEVSLLGSRSVRALLFSSIAPAVSVLPSSHCAGAVALFGSLPLPQSVGAIVQRVGGSRRSVDRWARRVGFNGAASLLRSVRLAWAWEFARSTPSNPWRRLSAECGYPSPRTFRVHSRRLLGFTPESLANAPLEDVLIGKLREGAMGPPRLA
jgi:hypothetical protein